MTWEHVALLAPVIIGFFVTLNNWIINNSPEAKKRAEMMGMEPTPQEDQSAVQKLDRLQEDVNKIEQELGIQVDRGKRSEDDIKRLGTQLDNVQQNVNSLKDSFHREMSTLKDMIMKRLPGGS